MGEELLLGGLASKQRLRPLDALLQPILEGLVGLADLDVLGDRRADHLRYRLVVDRSDGLERVSLVGRQPDGHGFDGFHHLQSAPRRYGCQVSR